MDQRVKYNLYHMRFNPICTEVLTSAEITPDIAERWNNKIADPYKRWYPDQGKYGQKVWGLKMVFNQVLVSIRSALAMMLVVLVVVVFMLSVADMPVGSEVDPDPRAQFLSNHLNPRTISPPPGTEAVVSGTSFRPGGPGREK